MTLTIYPTRLAGTVTPPPSKSQAHRFLIAAAQMGVGLGLTPPEVVEPIMELCHSFGLPTFIPIPPEDDGAWNAVVETVGLDKKAAGDQISLVLLDEMGKAAPRKMSRDEALGNLAALYGRA